jgi:hypothetical protein
MPLIQVLPNLLFKFKQSFIACIALVIIPPLFILCHAGRTFVTMMRAFFSMIAPFLFSQKWIMAFYTIKLVVNPSLVLIKSGFIFKWLIAPVLQGAKLVSPLRASQGFAFKAWR